MKTHRIKIQDKFLARIQSGEKTFEIRKNDRNYQVGDFIVFLRVDGTNVGLGKYITYITDYEQKDNYVVMSIADKMKKE